MRGLKVILVVGGLLLAAAIFGQVTRNDRGGDSGGGVDMPVVSAVAGPPEKFPALTMSPDMKCAADRQCSDQEFAESLQKLKSWWPNLPAKVQETCGKTLTLPAVYGCISQYKLQFLNENPNTEAHWAKADPFGDALEAQDASASVTSNERSPIETSTICSHPTSRQNLGFCADLSAVTPAQFAGDTWYRLAKTVQTSPRMVEVYRCLDHGLSASTADPRTRTIIVMQGCGAVRELLSLDPTIAREDSAVFLCSESYMMLEALGIRGPDSLTAKNIALCAAG